MQHQMLQKGDKIIVAVSGGPDSICLLHLLGSIKDEFALELHAAHVNHCLRGEESEGDEAYVREFCKDIGIPLHSKKVDINEYAKIKKLSSETAGREVRYSFFSELLEKLKADKIALAHNANDQAETMLMRIMRGTGIEGLLGIKPVREGIYIRPLLFLTRKEIERYCKENQLNPRIDSSNLQNIYNRNKIRLELIPYIQENFNNDIIQSLNRLSILITADNDFIEQESELRYDSYSKRENEKIILVKEAFDEKEAIITRMLRMAIRDLKGNLSNFEAKHIYDVIALQSQGTGKSIMLPRGITAENTYGDISLYYRGKEKDLVKAEVFQIIDSNRIKEAHKDGAAIQIKLKGTDYYIEFSLEHKGSNVNFKKEDFIKFFDYDKVKDHIIIRTRKEGDKFTPYGMKGQKKLKDFFIDEKIPKDQRDNIPLLCFDEEIAWVVGYRVSENFKVTKDTDKILKVSFISSNSMD
jgi:tRNA(Ile)-lysidine synthase